MSAYFTARLKVKDSDALSEYSKAAAPIIAKFGGKLLFKGGADDVLIGDMPLLNIAVFEFPDEAAVQTFFHSPEYQSLTSMREKGAEMVLSVHTAA